MNDFVWSFVFQMFFCDKYINWFTIALKKVHAIFRCFIFKEMQYITHVSAWIFYCKKPVNANRNTKLKTNTYVTNIVEHQEILEEIRSGNKYFWF